MRNIIIILLLLFGTISQVQAQKILVLDKIGYKLKRVKYYEGDFIAIQVLHDRTVFKGELNAISDSSFFINNNYVSIDSVYALIVYHKGAKGLSYTAFTVAAITSAILVIDQAIKGNIKSVPGKLFVPAAFVGIGIIAVPFWKRTLRIKNNVILKVIDLTPI
jgi:hypothetical protein